LYISCNTFMDAFLECVKIGRMSDFRHRFRNVDLLVIDDFAISPMGAAERNDLLELLDDRIGAHSTLTTSQLLVKQMHTNLNEPTLVDAILDRVVHSSNKIERKGTRSMRDDIGADVP